MAGSPLRPSAESQSAVCVVHRGCGFFPREGSLARTCAQLRSLPQASSRLPLTCLFTSQTQEAKPQWGGSCDSALVSPGRGMRPRSSCCWPGLAQHCRTHFSWRLEGTQGKLTALQQQQGPVGRAVNHPGQTSRNDSHGVRPCSSRHRGPLCW